MRIKMIALVGLLGWSIAGNAAQDGPSLSDQLLGNKDRNSASESGEGNARDAKRNTVIEVDEHSNEFTIPLSEKVHEDVTNVPTHGQSMDTVRESYGDPFKTSGPVGEPPITQWFYRDFVVYFEHDKVIHTVFRPQ